ncbi:MAG: hypothetical protein U1E10_14570 [Bdellovibrionales bacterium]|nr:hypothetical protein [Bdellovibrionales bacterium]
MLVSMAAIHMEVIKISNSTGEHHIAEISCVMFHQIGSASISSMSVSMSLRWTVLLGSGRISSSMGFDRLARSTNLLSDFGSEAI